MVVGQKRQVLTAVIETVRRAAELAHGRIGQSACG
jgi:hypothetical protein